MIASTPLEEIQHSLNGWLLRLRLRDAVVWAARGLIGGLALGLGLALAARAQPLFTTPELIRICAALAGGGLAALGLGAGLWPRRRLAASRYFDQVYDLQERTSTALEIASGRLRAPRRLAEQQLSDTLAAVREVDAREGLPIRVARAEGLAVLGLLAALALALWLPNSLEGQVEQQRALEAAVQQAVQQIEAIRQEAAGDPALSAEQREDLVQPLEEAQRRLEAGDLTREQAVAVLTDAERQLRQLADPQAQEQMQALQAAGQSLADNAATGALGERLAEGDLQQAARELANLDPTRMSPAEQAGLAQELAQAAGALQATNPELAGQLQQAADALGEGDAAAAQQALDQAGQTLAESAGQIAQAQAAGQAAGRLAAAGEQVARAGQAQQAADGAPGVGAPGQQGQQGQGEGQQGQGQGQGQGQAAGQGQGAGQQPGQGLGAGGAGRGESDGQAQGGQAGQGPAGDNGPGDGGVRSYEPIYAPSRIGGSGGPEVNLGGGGDPGDEIVGRGNTNPDGQAGGASVPYNEVYGEYSDAAHDAIRSGDVPIGLRPVVRDYFSSLAP